MRNLLASLGDHSMAMLRGIAELRGISPETNVREEMAESLASVFSQPGAVEMVLSALSPEAQAAWSDLLATNGRMKVPAFIRRYGTIRPVGPGKLEREMIWRQPASAAEELWYNGLVYRAFGDFGDGPLEYFYIPDDIASVAGSLSEVSDPTPTSALPVAEAPAASYQALNALAVDACTMLAAVNATPLRVAADSGRWRATDGAQIRDRLLVSDPARFALLISLGRRLGWLIPEGGKLTVQPQPVTAWLRKSAWEQTSDLFRCWQESVDWNDLRHVPTLRAEGTWRNDPVIARRGILGCLAGLSGDAWYGIDDLIGWIKSVDPDFQRPDGSYAGWYLRDVPSGRYLSGFEAWDEVEGRLVRFVITGPLYWLGAVALNAPDGTDASLFRLTPGGAYWIQGAALPELYPQARLMVDEQFQVTAPMSVPLYDRYRLLRFTEPANGPSEVGVPTCHRITRHSLATARANGIQGDKIILFLTRATGGDLPARVEAGLQRWGQHGGAVRITKGAVVRVEDASILAALRADPVVAPLLAELLSAQAALVREANLSRLLSALADLGYFTKLE